MWLYLSFILQSPWRVYCYRLGSQSESNPASELTCLRAIKYILTYKDFPVDRGFVIEPKNIVKSIR